LSEIAGIGNAKHATERQTEDNALHSALPSFPAAIFKAMFVPRIS
jgi:hypothetical protein